MSSDVTVDLIRSLVEAMNEPSSASAVQGPVEDWESLAIVLEFGDGYRSASGYAYLPEGAVAPVACRWSSIRPAVDAYLGSYYQPGDLLPVKILVQFERTTGKYEVTFEETDEDRWKTRPTNYRQMREELRPRLGGVRNV
ncbi:hypothetical protein [Micromonospora sagamiensis]|uniref:Uncharacterized protein n=1 Tax=Micromonospora sagamiensis TaxID=47875 RepID=A0A562WB62_9ACTN|nr:hypothetical protein [Micromonospora sagamiensis]TWJ27221.1 hypothetical protein JD81_00708 [Micromonospora sagamiensis]BCL13884.1 hypothetical protein GCM10017556_16230 [Micromonospora sagamiensis]